MQSQACLLVLQPSRVGGAMCHEAVHGAVAAWLAVPAAKMLFTWWSSSCASSDV